MSIRQKLFFLSFIVLLGNGAVGYTVYQSNQKLQDSEQWVKHSEQVISLSSQILSLSKDIETSSRGFVITNDSTFLVPFNNAENIIFTNIEKLKLLIQDNPKQRQYVDTLDFYMHKRLKFSLECIEIRKVQGLDSVIALVSTKEGKSFTEKLLKTVTALQQEENKLLKQRQQKNEDSASTLNMFSMIMFIVMTVFTVLILIAVGNYLLQNKEKEKRATELLIANKELLFQNEEKEKRANELIIANKELIFQTEEKEKRATELLIADKELAFQTEEKVKRADELIIANKELIFQNREKEKRADELIIANKELIFQNDEKEKRANELIIANKELIFQNEEKEKRADELIISNNERDYQSEEKVKQEDANKELEAFSYSISHDLRAPLRHIGGFIDLLLKNNSSQLDSTGMRYLNIISESSHEMGNLIDALLTFSRLSRVELQKTKINSREMVSQVFKMFSDELNGRNIEINILELADIVGDETLINQVWINLISNALKYTRNKEKAIIEIGSLIENGQTIFYIKDNGAGFDMEYSGKLFGVFQRLHKAKDFEGIGIGLANVNRIVMRHNGKCRAESEVGNGATFYFNIPNN